MLSDILLFPLTGPLRGVAWLAQKIKEQADEEVFSEKAIRRRLYALNEALENHEITEQEFEEDEAVLLDMLEGVQAQRREEINE